MARNKNPRVNASAGVVLFLRKHGGNFNTPRGGFKKLKTFIGVRTDEGIRGALRVLVQRNVITMDGNPHNAILNLNQDYLGADWMAKIKEKGFKYLNGITNLEKRLNETNVVEKVATPATDLSNHRHGQMSGKIVLVLRHQGGVVTIGKGGIAKTLEDFLKHPSNHAVYSALKRLEKKNVIYFAKSGGQIILNNTFLDNDWVTKLDKLGFRNLHELTELEKQLNENTSIVSDVPPCLSKPHINSIAVPFSKANPTLLSSTAVANLKSQSHTNQDYAVRYQTALDEANGLREELIQLQDKYIAVNNSKESLTDAYRSSQARVKELEVNNKQLEVNNKQLFERIGELEAELSESDSEYKKLQEEIADKEKIRATQVDKININRTLINTMSFAKSGVVTMPSDVTEFKN